MKKLGDWYWLLHDDPERWVVTSAGAGMIVFFVLSWFTPHAIAQMLVGAGLLCAAMFWLFLILGMAGWPR